LFDSIATVFHTHTYTVLLLLLLLHLDIIKGFTHQLMHN
jgi:hypothetical protein